MEDTKFRRSKIKTKINAINEKLNNVADEFSVKNMHFPYITFKLTGKFGEKSSKRFALYMYNFTKSFYNII